ncbi:MAG: pentapeptide repeat-containing protein, partial [Actinomyces sp.]
IDELDLSGIDAQRVHFEDCRVGTLRLHGGSLRDVDLRGLEMRTVSGVGSLAGATVSSGQLSELAPLLTQHLGLRVTDQDHVQNVTTRSRRA